MCVRACVRVCVQHLHLVVLCNNFHVSLDGYNNMVFNRCIMSHRLNEKYKCILNILSCQGQDVLWFSSIPNQTAQGREERPAE